MNGSALTHKVTEGGPLPPLFAFCDILSSSLVKSETSKSFEEIELLHFEKVCLFFFYMSWPRSARKHCPSSYD